VWETDPATGEKRRRFARLAGYSGRGVITTATYEARALGVNSAMGLMRAAQHAPDAVLLPVDFDEYRRYSRLFKAAVRESRRWSRTAASTRSTST
jgi:DNA polymerase IV